MLNKHRNGGLKLSIQLLDVHVLLRPAVQPRQPLPPGPPLRPRPHPLLRRAVRYSAHTLLLIVSHIGVCASSRNLCRGLKAKIFNVMKVPSCHVHIGFSVYTGMEEKKWARLRDSRPGRAHNSHNLAHIFSCISVDFPILQYARKRGQLQLIR